MSTNLISYSVWVLRQPGSLLAVAAITKLRGAIAPSRYGKFLPTFHPAYLMRGQRHLRPVVQLDFEKPLARERHFRDVRRPERFIYIPEEVTEIDWAIREMANARYLSVDIETVEDQITCIGFAWSAEHALVIPIWDFSKSDRSIGDTTKRSTSGTASETSVECPSLRSSRMGFMTFIFSGVAMALCLPIVSMIRCYYIMRYSRRCKRA
jgi:hypothetical protein